MSSRTWTFAAQVPEICTSEVKISTTPPFPPARSAATRRGREAIGEIDLLPGHRGAIVHDGLAAYDYPALALHAQCGRASGMALGCVHGA
jgi:hypothetical protein